MLEFSLECVQVTVKRFARRTIISERTRAEKSICDVITCSTILTGSRCAVVKRNLQENRNSNRKWAIFNKTGKKVVFSPVDIDSVFPLWVTWGHWLLKWHLLILYKYVIAPQLLSAWNLSNVGFCIFWCKFQTSLANNEFWIALRGIGVQSCVEADWARLIGSAPPSFISNFNTIQF